MMMMMMMMMMMILPQLSNIICCLPRVLLAEVECLQSLFRSHALNQIRIVEDRAKDCGEDVVSIRTCRH